MEPARPLEGQTTRSPRIDQDVSYYVHTARAWQRACMHTTAVPQLGVGLSRSRWWPHGPADFAVPRTLSGNIVLARSLHDISCPICRRFSLPHDGEIQHHSCLGRRRRLGSWKVTTDRAEQCAGWDSSSCCRILLSRTIWPWNSARLPDRSTQYHRTPPSLLLRQGCTPEAESRISLPSQRQGGEPGRDRRAGPGRDVMMVETSQYGH